MFEYWTLFQFFCLIISGSTVHGAVRFANYYQDHMVLQRAPQQAIVWGYTDASSASITLVMDNQVYQTVSSSYTDPVNASTWSVTLDAQTQEGPFDIKVTQTTTNGTLETITLSSVLFGDVWMCSGQSNMQFAVNEMFNASAEIENAHNYPKVRLFTTGQRVSAIPKEELMYIALNWSIPANATLKSNYVSAVCWLYGRMVHEALGGRPIGLIHSSWGGTGIELWSPPEVLNACNISETTMGISEEEQQQQQVYPEQTLAMNKTALYNSMIHPFTRMVIKGAIWYQGEFNSNYNLNKYNCTFPKLIEYWRSIWYTRTNSTTDPTFPFGFVQLAANAPSSTYVGGFPWIRWHQTFDVGYVPNNMVPNVFMAVALDLRDDGGGIHPRDKLDVGYRLSRSGLAVAYGFNNVTYQGPIIVNLTVASDSSKVNVTYSNVVSQSIELRNQSGFEVCCVAKQICNTNDTIWVPTPASKIEGVPLTISLAVPSSCQSQPINALRYLWRETPCLFKKAAVYSGEDSNIPGPPYIHYF